ncbi:glycosyl transferase GT17 family protein [Butyrivibrio sp.]|uniref:glycosyl transferase GT17 family protein n=1 Tax=Butyrivibrio sp. TaxID=28121 RepID=UPI0025C6E8C4|nr:glycosyl transferase GT17 family protein [Butyrivibrio sp.]MBQ7430036.1 glycosyl transferase GT17 family protein [Butyrivibrio sp.]MBQ9303048.1 glycosyl transferase GT17 family protein [Butyrivibrio sp.]
MVYDCIPFFNEVDILKLRLNILSPLVDRFIIEEATMTFSGEPKELCFEKNKEMFKEFLDKITYIVVDDTPKEAITHERDYFQKNHLIEGLSDASEDDVIIMSDVDEIPNPTVLKQIIDNFDKTKVYHLAQRNFYAFMNMEETSGKLLSITGEFEGFDDGDRKWLGTKICNINNIPKEGIVRLRDLVKTSDPRSVRVADGGWHFGYMGGHNEYNAAKRIGVKVQAAAHQEYNEKEILKETMDRLKLGQDIFGRDARFERVEVDDSYPEYLLEHKAEYQYLIMPEITSFDRFMAKMDMTVGRFCRKGFRHVLRKLRLMK